MLIRKLFAYGISTATMITAFSSCDNKAASEKPETAGVADNHADLASRNQDPKPADTKATCSQHGLAAITCPFCKPDLVRAGGMCAEHGVPEALCWTCRPELLDAYKRQNDWCGGHDRPESLCFICNPEREAIVAGIMGLGADTGNGKATQDIADLPRAQRAPAVHCSTSNTQIRLVSSAVAASAGFAVGPVEVREISQTLSCNAEIAYDANRYARVSPRVSGVVQSVAKDAGAPVATGDVLAVVDSAELAIAKAEYLQAVETKKLWEKNHDATHALVERGIAGSQEDLAAENKLAEAAINHSKATQQLKVLGLSAEQISAVEQSQDTSPLLSLTAPFEGEIVERSAVIGETVDSSKPLFTVADTRRMWAELDVYERDISMVRVDQPVVVSVDGLRGESFAGKVTWVSRQIDPKTRTLRVRAELTNDQGDLRANMFGKAEITVHDRESLLVVPKAAVQWDGCCNVAFVRTSDTTFEPRKLRLGTESGEYFQVNEGLKAGETVVTLGSFMLKTEIMKNSIGAGCCEAR